MPIYTIQVPTGQRLKIEAPDEATALRGAQEWQPPAPAAPKNQSRLGMVEEALPEGQQPNIGGKGMMKPGDRVPTSLSSQGQQGMSLNLGDEAVAMMGAPLDVGINKLTGEGPTSLGESYQQIRAFQNAQDARTKGEHPYLSTGANLVGGLASTPKIIGKALEGGTTAEKILRGFGTGGAMGGASAFGSGGERLPDRLKGLESGIVSGAALGTAFPTAGTILGKAASGTGKLLGNTAKAQFEMAPSFENLQAASKAAYGAGDAAASAIKLAPKEYQNLALGFSQIAKDHGVGGSLGKMTAVNYPNSLQAMRNWYDITLGVLKGEHPIGNYHELEVMRQGMRKAVNSSFREGRMTPDGEMMDRMIDKVDDVMLRSPYAEARKAYRTMRKSEIIEDAFTRAENSAPQFSQAGLEKTLRDQFKRIANNKKLFSMYSKEEQAAIMRVVRPGNMQMALRGLGALSPKGGVSTAFNILLNMQSLGIGLPFTAAAMGARAASTKMGLNNARAVSAMVRNGGTLPQPKFPKPQQTSAFRLAEPTPDELDIIRPSQGDKSFAIKKQGETVGFANIRLNGNEAEVRDIYSITGNMANSFGPSAMRQLMRDFGKSHPGVKFLTGERVSGGRTGGVHRLAGEGTHVKIPMPPPPTFSPQQGRPSFIEQAPFGLIPYFASQ